MKGWPIIVTGSAAPPAQTWGSQFFELRVIWPQQVVTIRDVSIEGNNLIGPMMSELGSKADITHPNRDPVLYPQ
jgi:hypothetical protein